MVYIVVPAYNEEKNIGRVLRGLFQELSDSNFNQEACVVVVDDGSNDGTQEVAKKEGATVLVHVVNRGQGAALQTGNEFALAHGATAIIHFDADGQMDPHDIFGALNALRESCSDVVMGSRFLDNRTNLPWFKKNILLPLARNINMIFAGISLTDVHNGFRVLTRAAAEKLTITQDGMAHNTEIPSLVKRYNLRYVEYPVKITYNEFGQGVRGGIKIVRDLLVASLIRHS